jgi:hypothetical protein
MTQDQEHVQGRHQAVPVHIIRTSVLQSQVPNNADGVVLVYSPVAVYVEYQFAIHFGSRCLGLWKVNKRRVVHFNPRKGIPS